MLQGAPTDHGSNGGPGSYDHATGPEDVLVSVSLQIGGGNAPLEYELRNNAQFLLLGDGTAIVAGATDASYPGPAILPLQSTTITEQQIHILLAAADDAGLLDGPIDYGDPGVTDASNTVVNITVGGRSVSQSAYALGMHEDSPNLSAANRSARTAMQGFIDAAQSLVGADSQHHQARTLLALPGDSGCEQ